MSAFADDCREKAARYAERAAGFRMAGDEFLARLSREVAINLAASAKVMDAIERMEPDAAERMQA